MRPSKAPRVSSRLSSVACFWFFSRRPAASAIACWSDECSSSLAESCCTRLRASACCCDSDACDATRGRVRPGGPRAIGSGAAEAPGGEPRGPPAPPRARGSCAGGRAARKRSDPSPSLRQLHGGRLRYRRRTATRARNPTQATARALWAAAGRRPARPWSVPSGTCAHAGAQPGEHWCLASSRSVLAIACRAPRGRLGRLLLDLQQVLGEGLVPLRRGRRQDMMHCPKHQPAGRRIPRGGAEVRLFLYPRFSNRFPRAR